MDSNVLIRKIQEYPELYDRKNKNYTNMEVKKDIWQEIANEFNEPEEMVRTRWRNIRDAYQKSIRRKAELEEMGKGALYKKYKFEDQLEYLLPFCSTIKRRKLARSSPTHRPIKVTKVFLKSENDNIIGEVYEDDFENVERLDEMEDTHCFDTSNFKLIDESGNEEHHFEHAELISDTENQVEEKVRIRETNQQEHHQYIVTEQLKPRDITVNFFVNMAQTVF